MRSGARGCRQLAPTPPPPPRLPPSAGTASGKWWAPRRTCTTQTPASMEATFTWRPTTSGTRCEPPGRAACGAAGLPAAAAAGVSPAVLGACPASALAQLRLHRPLQHHGARLRGQGQPGVVVLFWSNGRSGVGVGSYSSHHQWRCGRSARPEPGSPAPYNPTCLPACLPRSPTTTSRSTLRSTASGGAAPSCARRASPPAARWW